MKKIISLVVLVSSISFAQNLPTGSILELKVIQSRNDSHQTSSNKYQASSIRYQETSVQDFSSEKKSPALAVLYSLLLPGMGELYANRYDTGKYFTIADGVLWGVFAGFNIYGNWQEKNYKSFAESKGGVSLNGKDSDYYANIGNYLSIDEYNAAMDLQGNFSKVYNTATQYWKWNSNDQRREYRNMWSSSEQAFNNERFAIGALILNRVISAINAVRLVNSHNKNLSQQVSWNLYFDVDNKPMLPQSISFNFVKSF
ncbi:MAG: hypothetical protein M1495_08795 [Bacteroidetes bacterium]|nr:hypothetical protein [Bacteroidota bacterium]